MPTTPARDDAPTVTWHVWQDYPTSNGRAAPGPLMQVAAVEDNPTRTTDGLPWTDPLPWRQPFTGRPQKLPHVGTVTGPAGDERLEPPLPFDDVSALRPDDVAGDTGRGVILVLGLIP